MADQITVACEADGFSASHSLPAPWRVNGFRSFAVGLNRHACSASPNTQRRRTAGGGRRDDPRRRSPARSPGHRPPAAGTKAPRAAPGPRRRRQPPRPQKERRSPLFNHARRSKTISRGGGQLSKGVHIRSHEHRRTDWFTGCG